MTTVSNVPVVPALQQLPKALVVDPLVGVLVVDKVDVVRTGPPVGVGIGSLPMTPNKNGEIGVLCVESVLAGTGRYNKT